MYSIASLHPLSIPRIERKGIISTLAKQRETRIPLFGNWITGMMIAPANTIETSGYRDHVNAPWMARLQMAQTAILISPIRAIMVLIDLRVIKIRFFEDASAYSSVALTNLSLSGADSTVFSSPSNSPTDRPSVHDKADRIDISGYPAPRSHFETALSVTPNFSANCFWVRFIFFLCSTISEAICSIASSPSQFVS